ncbi:hypothetical protein [Flavobacterium sp. J27]|uniref:hypothetical protein n=1 Tax=Flavobacterium sp. J27 TaxID=2060419 RepID=UPI001031998E|nr:hypothetical protein [Flavobacterium sp. J27]
MKLTLQPNKQNKYPLSGILIKGNSPLIWLSCLQELNIEISLYSSYAIPSKIANELYGCLVVMPIDTIKKTHKHQYVQCYEGQIFIPGFSVLFPFITKDEMTTIFGENKHFLHPEIGLVELTETINWIDLVANTRKINVKIKQPNTSVYIPKKLQSLHVEYDEEALLESLENPLTDEEKLDNLPFNMKKLMEGNKKEMEKFLAFMDKNPELAMKYAIPLDTLGTARGNQLGTFKFGHGFFNDYRGFSGFFGFSDFTLNSKNTSQPSKSSAVNKITMVLISGIIISLVFYLIYFLIQNNINSFQELSLKSADNKSSDIFVLSVFGIAIGLILFRLFQQSKLDLSGNIAPIFKILMLIILIFTVYYLLSYFYHTFGLFNWHVLLVLIFIAILIYRLFNRDGIIFKEKNEK